MVICEEVLAIYHSDASWQSKFDSIFSSEITTALAETGIEFEWVETDSTYQADVTAYVEALTRKANELKKLGSKA